MGMTSLSANLKRKPCAIDNLLEAKRSLNLSQMQQELASLCDKKLEFLRAQKRASLFVDSRRIGAPSVMIEFPNLFKKACSLPLEDLEEQKRLIEDIVKESIVIEWPRVFPGVYSDQPETELDFAPLIHRARNVVKCRTSHPTMRVKIYALSEGNEMSCPQIVEAFYRASLVKLGSDSPDSKYRQLAGKMILTQREGIAATKSAEQSGAVVNAEGKLLCSQSSSNAQILIFANQLQESNVRTTSLKYENGFLCATFPEMGVTLNSMVDRRQLSTRYAIQVEVHLNIDNKMIVVHTLVSHPFLIAITNDQTEPLLQSIFWNRLLNCDQYDGAEIFPEKNKLPWGILRQAIRAFIKSQIPQARFLTEYELRHVQAMLLLPRILRCSDLSDLQLIEINLFGSVGTQKRDLHEEMRRLRNRLLSESILDSFPVDRKEFITEKCISVLDMSTELAHTTWQWLHKSCEMIQDVGHKLCPSPACDKKSSKTKKQMAACEDYQTVISLFNKGFITFCSTQKAATSFAYIERNSSMLIRFCDENIGHFSICYGLENGKPKLGSISAEQVKDFKQGLPEMLIDEHFPSKYHSLIKMSLDENEDSITAVRKRDVFHTYKTERRSVESVSIMDNETNRIDVLSGALLLRQSPSPQSLNPPLIQHFDIASIANNNSTLAQSIFPLLHTLSGNLDIGSLLKNFSESNKEIEDPDDANLSDTSGEDAATSSIASLLQNSESHEEEEHNESGNNLSQLLLKQYH